VCVVLYIIFWYIILRKQSNSELSVLTEQIINLYHEIQGDEKEYGLLTPLQVCYGRRRMVEIKKKKKKIFFIFFLCICVIKYGLNNNKKEGKNFADIIF
jgi:hypothetical protein